MQVMYCAYALLVLLLLPRTFFFAQLFYRTLPDRGRCAERDIHIRGEAYSMYLYPVHVLLVYFAYVLLVPVF